MSGSGRPGPQGWGPGAGRLLMSAIPGACVFFLDIVTQSFCDLPVGIRGSRMVEFSIQSQHPAIFPAIVAPPDIFLKINIHLAPAVTAKRTVHINTVRLLAPNAQIQQIDNFHDAKRKFIRV